MVTELKPFQSVFKLLIVQVHIMLMIMFNYVFKHVHKINLNMVKTVLHFVQTVIMEIKQPDFVLYQVVVKTIIMPKMPLDYV